MLALAIQAAASPNPDAVGQGPGGAQVQELGGRRPFHFRYGDHAGVSSVFAVEGKFSNEYKFWPAYVEEAPNREALLVPCGQTKCEPLVKG